MSNPFEVLRKELNFIEKTTRVEFSSIIGIREALKNCWQSPHSAMEMLLVVAETLPLLHANNLIKEVVIAWRNELNYSWNAGGSADHCLLGALVISGNGHLAEINLVAKCKATVAHRDTVVKRQYGRHIVLDEEAKVELARVWLKNGNSTEFVQLIEVSNFESSCQILAPDFGQINQELISYFANNPARLQEMHWRKFEELLDAIFKNQGYTTELGPGSNDGGIDLRLIQKDSIGNICTLVQAKRYKSENAITLEAVQALHGVVDDEKAHRGLFVTTSKYLPSVKKFAERQQGRLVLADSSDVASWCKGVLSKGLSFK